MAVYQFYEEDGGTWFHFGDFHGVMVSDPFNQPIQTYQIPGVYGVAHLVDRTKDRHLSCEHRIQGFETYYDLEANLATIDAVNGSLFGDVFFDGPLASTYYKCTFLHFERTSLIKYDGSGQNGWWVEGRLHWIQRTQ